MIEIGTIMKNTEELLRAHPFCKRFWPQHIERLAGMASEVHFRSGELIFHEADHSSLFYLLISGTVALEVVDPGRPVRVATLFAGEVLGWSSLTESDDKQFQARALEGVRALAFDGTRLRHACEEDYALGYMLMQAVLSVMAGRLHTVRAQLLELYQPVEAAVL
jgi:CRP/FNR family cyclic AMP-dependent transcriptional regulator